MWTNKKFNYYNNKGGGGSGSYYYNNNNKGGGGKWNNKSHSHDEEIEDAATAKRKMFWMIGGSLLFFFFLWVIRNIWREKFDRPAILDNYFKKMPTPEKVKGESKGETVCRQVAEKVFKKPFNKVRPDFLRNNVTGHNLELDIYNEELKIAIEYNGKQHYDYVPFFHKNYEHFMNQKYRDEIKKMICKQHNIHLIEVSYEVSLDDIETFIRLEARKLGYDA